MDGVENAADTLPDTLNGDGDDGLSGSVSGIAVRDGGVSGAPNIASSIDGTAGSGRGRGVTGDCTGFSSGGAGCSLLIAGVNFGEKGGVRCRAGVGCWLGTDDGGAAAFGVGIAGARGDGGSARGTGGGQAGGAACPGVRPRVETGFAPGVLPTPAVAGTAGSSSPQLTAAPTGIRPPQIEHRARMETLVILAGSSRKTDLHSGQETFIESAGLAVFADLCAAVPE